MSSSPKKRTALILASIALMFFIGIMVKTALFGR